MSRRRTITAVVLAIGAVSAAHARQAAQAPAAATASIRGTVTSDENPPHPIARAVVTLAGTTIQPARVIVADDQGRFAFSQLPTGVFTITASKPSYVTMSYGQTVPGKGTGVPLFVSGGHDVGDITIKLAAGAAIAGRVVDAFGQPLPGSPVIAQQYRLIDGEPKLVSVSGHDGVTDAAGAYRIFGLAPGDYYICALPPGIFIVNDPTFAIGADTHRTTAEEIQWARRQLQSGAAGATAAVPGAVSASEPAPARTFAYGPMYAPGVADPTRATSTTVASGQDLDGVDIAMPLQPTAQIKGQVVMPDNQRAANVMISRYVGNSSSTSNSADGTFVMTNLLPGTYAVSARAASNSLWGWIDVPVAGENVAGVVLRLQPSVTLEGHVVFDGAAPRTAPPQLTLWPTHGTPTRVPVGADGAFSFGTIAPDRYRMTTQAAGWTLKSVVTAGKDVTDATFEIPETGLTDLVVTLTDHPSELSGRLIDPSGQPVPGYYVVVFSADQSQWRPGTRRLPAPARTATDGTFKFSGLPAGTYYMAALTDFDQADLGDVSMLQRLIAASVQISLADGEKKTQELRLR